MMVMMVMEGDEDIPQICQYNSNKAAGEKKVEERKQVGFLSIQIKSHRFCVFFWPRTSKAHLVSYTPLQSWMEHITAISRAHMSLLFLLNIHLLVASPALYFAPICSPSQSLPVAVALLPPCLLCCQARRSSHSKLTWLCDQLQMITIHHLTDARKIGASSNHKVFARKQIQCNHRTSVRLDPLADINLKGLQPC